MNLDIAGNISEFDSLTKEFLTRRVIYRTIFRGKGVEFDGYRDFVFDDDAVDIDWRASTRANKLLVRQYIEERNLKILFVIDVSDNMLFGSTNKLKCEYAAELSATLAHLIVSSNDKVGFVFFNDKITKIVLPAGGITQFDIFVDELSNSSVYGGISDIRKTLESLLDYLDDSINSVIIISDFIRLKKEFLKTINLFSSRFETMVVIIKDPLDKKMSKIKGEMVIEDPVTKEQAIIDPSVVGKAYEKNALEQENMVKKIFLDCGVDFLDLTTDKPFPFPLAEFLIERIEKRKYIIPIK